MVNQILNQWNQKAYPEQKTLKDSKQKTTALVDLIDRNLWIILFVMLQKKNQKWLKNCLKIQIFKMKSNRLYLYLWIKMK